MTLSEHKLSAGQIHQCIVIGQPPEYVIKDRQGIEISIQIYAEKNLFTRKSSSMLSIFMAYV